MVQRVRRLEPVAFTPARDRGAADLLEGLAQQLVPLREQVKGVVGQHAAEPEIDLDRG